ncbi:uncharacterized protein LOC143260481 [Megalopta genalis]|uniref:uncharacterized protein LOC143260481 n=1 Tax=Megalopta genalis TaxID=115081 RepID=UPI003FD1B0D0
MNSQTEAKGALGITVPSLPSDTGKQLSSWIIVPNLPSQTEEQLTNPLSTLISPLKDDAARTVQSLGISDSNYVLAWTALTNRYNDSNALIQHHVKALFDISPVTKLSHTNLRHLLDDFTNHLLALESLNEQVFACSSILIHLFSTRLDASTKREWEKHVMKYSDKPTWNQMSEFLENHCKYLERMEIDKPVRLHPPSNTVIKTAGRYKREHPPTVASYVIRAVKECPLCSEEHPLYVCSHFQKLSQRARNDKVKQLNLCFNCLRSGHSIKECSSGQCKKCFKRHHTTLHIEADASALGSQVNKAMAPEPASSVSLTSTHFHSDGVHVLLPTAIVYVEDRQGRKHRCRALLDPGSQSNFMTEELSAELRLQRESFSGTFSGLARKLSVVNSWTQTNLHSCVTSFKTPLRCLIIPQITENLPNVSMESNAIPVPKNVKLADPQFYKTRKIDILIGGGLFWKLMCVGQVNVGSNYPIMQKTQLGWVVAGGMCSFPYNKQQKLACHLVTNEDLQNQLQRFWAIEETNDCPYKTINNECEQYFRETTTRDASGRFMVRIPFKSEISGLGESKLTAEKRLYAMERKFKKDPGFKGEYMAFMREYEELGHMTQLIDDNKQDRGFYLPHHAVIKQTSNTTKLRVVFDGSAKTTTGMSLNDVQRIGPTVQDDLLAITLRFRKHKYVMSADIEKMYRQIHIAPDERRFQKILWRTDDKLPIQVFQLNTVTYGTASAPFLATRSLTQLGDDHASNFPLASHVIKKDFYVDDLLTGTDTIEETNSLRQHITHILNTAGFQLRKWASNDSRILTTQDACPKNVRIQFDKDPKTLGLLWMVQEDTLNYSVTISSEQRITKRTILSEISKIFDPLGLLGTSWDESLPQDLHSEWELFHHQLASLNEISIPRLAIGSKKGLELHGFCDASERAYGACIYLRSINERGQYIVRLLCANSRVAPLKKITLPRLELCGAVLLAQLANKVKTALELALREFYWCDSTIVLAWVKAPSDRWKTYIANRVSEIQHLTTNAWSHINTEENPADIISRGIQPATLKSTRLWWYGPTWLSKDSNWWPKSENLIVNQASEDTLEHKNPCALAGTVNSDWDLFDRYSSYNRLIRVTAYCLKFIYSVKKKKGSNSSIRNETTNNACSKHLTVRDLDKAIIVLVKLAQRNAFSKELRLLESSRIISRTSKLRSFNPFLDSNGVIRLGGRLANAQLNYDEKYPIILPAKHQLTRLIIKHEHIQLLHAGCQLVMSAIRRRYWPLSLRTTVKGILRQCVQCFRVKPRLASYTMGDLPASRIIPSRAFTTCGVDYAGPFPIKEKSRCRVIHKAYICIFVCFATKAVHIELATDLTTQAFLNCLRRFFARRGMCAHIYSDNGTNFVGARIELISLGALLSSDNHKSQMTEFCSTRNVQWHFIPPNAPHFGGLWEGAVKSAKYHLKRVVGETNLTFEELYTVLIQVESCMNSRPLCPLNDDPSDLTPLTPNHFLIGGTMTSLPDADVRHVQPNRLIRYQHLQYMLQHFWSRWQGEYLHQLQQRHKWQLDNPSKFRLGTLVVVKEDNLPPLRWRTGRIIELHPGKDGNTRVVSIKLSDTILRRPVTKICILPVDDDLDQPQTAAQTTA